MREKKPKPPTPEKAAAEWIELKTQKAQIEGRLDELKKILEPFLENEPDKRAFLHGFDFFLVETSREYFDLKRAREKIDGRVLAPYMASTSYSSIRTTWKGEPK